jgi:hypothetical protein
MMHNKYLFETFSSDQMSFDQEFTKYLKMLQRAHSPKSAGGGRG